MASPAGDNDASATVPTGAGPLAGVRIVAFTQFLLGPAACQYLADLGADLIKVERPGVGAFERTWAGGDCFLNGESAFYLMTHRNCRSIALDLRSESGVAVAKQLVNTADVLIENFRPGVMERLGLSYEDLSAHNPELIYASASGFGESEALRRHPGQDLLLQAMTGLMSITGTSGQPPTPAGAPVIDQHGASLLAMAVCAALLQRERTGRGQQLKLSMLEAAMDLQMEPFVYWLNGSELRKSAEPLGSTFHPAPYGVYEVTDGYIAISMSPVEAVLEALDDVVDGTDPMRKDVPSGNETREEAYSRVASRVRRLDRETAVRVLRDASIWVAPVSNYDELMGTAGVEELDLVIELDHPRAGAIKLARHPVRYGSGLPGITRTPPSVGEHTEEILAQLRIADESGDNHGYHRAETGR